jgi:hypothetical protein
MDPNECLKEIRRIVATNDTPDQETAHRLVMLFDALDQWIESGGFLPEDWQRDQRGD